MLFALGAIIAGCTYSHAFRYATENAVTSVGNTQFTPTTATYTGAATGVIGAAAAGGFGLVKNMANNDFEAAAKNLVEGAKAIVGEAAAKAATEVAEGLTGAEGARGLALKAFGQADNPYMEVLFDKMELRPDPSNILKSNFLRSVFTCKI